MLGTINWSKIAKTSTATLLAALLSLGAIAPHPAIAARAKKTDRSASPVQTKLAGKLTEVAPPAMLQELSQAFADNQPQVTIQTPRSNEVLSSDTVSVQFQVKDLSLFKNPDLGLGPHLHVFLDDQPYQAVYDISKPLVLEKLSPGTHTIRAFASRPWHESFKNEGAYAQTTFHVFTKTGDNSPDPNLPLLTYSRPQGSYGAEPIMLDFYLTNAPLHLVAQEDKKDEIADWRIRCTVNGESFVLDQWQPLYLKGFKPGQNWVQLEFLDETGTPVKNVFNNTARLMTFEPGGQDTLSKLVRGDLSLVDARGIVDANYKPPAPTPAPSPTPTPTVPVVKATPAPSPVVPPVKPTIPPASVPSATPKDSRPVEQVTPVPTVTSVPVAPPKLDATPEAESEKPEVESEKMAQPEAIATPTPTPTASPVPSPAPPQPPQKAGQSPVQSWLKRLQKEPKPKTTPTVPVVLPTPTPAPTPAPSVKEAPVPRPVIPSPGPTPSPAIASPQSPSALSRDRVDQPQPAGSPSSTVAPVAVPQREQPGSTGTLPKVEPESSPSGTRSNTPAASIKSDQKVPVGEPANELSAPVKSVQTQVSEKASELRSKVSLQLNQFRDRLRQVSSPKPAAESGPVSPVVLPTPATVAPTPTPTSASPPPSPTSKPSEPQASSPTSASVGPSPAPAIPVTSTPLPVVPTPPAPAPTTTVEDTSDKPLTPAEQYYNRLREK